MKIGGRLFLLKIEEPADSGTYVTIAGQRATSKSLSVEQLDVTDKDDSRWRKLLEGGVQALSISGKGLLQNAASHALLVELARTGAMRRFQLVFSDGYTFAQPMQVSDFGGSGDYKVSQQYTLTLESSDDSSLRIPIPLLLIESGPAVLLVEGGEPLLLTEFNK